MFKIKDELKENILAKEGLKFKLNFYLGLILKNMKNL